jgi:hypothetical protein
MTNKIAFFRCDQCSAVFLSKVGLKMHLIMMHKKDKRDVFGSDDDDDDDDDDNEVEDLEEARNKMSRCAI